MDDLQKRVVALEEQVRVLAAYVQFMSQGASVTTQAQISAAVGALRPLGTEAARLSQQLAKR